MLVLQVLQLEDSLTSVSGVEKGSYSRELVAAIDHALLTHNLRADGSNPLTISEIETCTS